jgi:hypothetical protein
MGLWLPSLLKSVIQVYFRAPRLVRKQIWQGRVLWKEMEKLARYKGCWGISEPWRGQKGRYYGEICGNTMLRNMERPENNRIACKRSSDGEGHRKTYKLAYFNSVYCHKSPSEATQYTPPFLPNFRSYSIKDILSRTSNSDIVFRPLKPLLTVGFNYVDPARPPKFWVKRQEEGGPKRQKGKVVKGGEVTKRTYMHNTAQCPTQQSANSSPSQNNSINPIGIRIMNDYHAIGFNTR